MVVTATVGILPHSALLTKKVGKVDKYPTRAGGKKSTWTR
jgi:hypothetical protein